MPLFSSRLRGRRHVIPQQNITNSKCQGARTYYPTREHKLFMMLHSSVPSKRNARYPQNNTSHPNESQTSKSQIQAHLKTPLSSTHPESPPSYYPLHLPQKQPSHHTRPQLIPHSSGSTPSLHDSHLAISSPLVRAQLHYLPRKASDP